MGGIRRIGYALAVVACVGAVLAATAYAAVEARLAGPFHVRVTVLSGNIQTPGSHFIRKWRFEPICPSGPCERVRLHRQLPGGHGSAKSILHRTGPGRYKGTERMRVTCGGETGHQVSRVRLRITKRQDGQARKFRGRGRLRVFGCGGHLVDRAKFQGRSLR